MASITFLERGRGPWTDLETTVTIRDDQNNLVAGAAVDARLWRAGRQWFLGGTTDASGEVTWKLQSARLGETYYLEVDDLAHSSYLYDRALADTLYGVNLNGGGEPMESHLVVGA